MKLKHYFAILVALLLVIEVILFIFTSGKPGMLFYIVEGVTWVSIIYLIFFYRKVVKPLDDIANGMDLLREQDFSSRLKEVGQRETDRVVTVFNDMMSRLKEERLRLREQNRFLDLLIAASPMGVIILDFDGRIQMANNSALRMLEIEKREDVTGATLAKLPSPLATQLAQLPKESEKTLRLSDSMIYRCRHLTFPDRGFAHPFMLIESLTDEIVKAEKKAYEQVIRMIAHEVNNTVAGVSSALESVADVIAETDNNQELHEIMRICIERNMNMSRFITNFANVVKIPPPQPIATELNTTIASWHILLDSICRKHNITLHIETCDRPLPVNIDTILFEQVIANIVKNAVESIGEGGDIYIRTTAHPTTLEIADNGKGISKEVEQKIFSPFFSTKAHGQGIGLIFVREVLSAHHCIFSLRTCNDGLTRFVIKF